MEGRVSFPVKLHACLIELEQTEQSHVASFQPHGCAIMVHKPDDFLAVSSRWFSMTKIESFQRQLNIYGFQRITRGPDKNAYFHPLFQRGHAALATRIPRLATKGAGPRQVLDCCPDFSAAPYRNGNALAPPETSLGQNAVMRQWAVPTPFESADRTAAQRVSHPNGVRFSPWNSSVPPRRVLQPNGTIRSDQLSLGSSLMEHRAAMLALSIDLDRQELRRDLEQRLQQRQQQELSQLLRQQQQQNREQQELEQRVFFLAAPNFPERTNLQRPLALRRQHSEPFYHASPIDTVGAVRNFARAQNVALPMERHGGTHSLIPMAAPRHHGLAGLDHRVLAQSQSPFEALTQTLQGNMNHLSSSRAHGGQVVPNPNQGDMTDKK